VYISILDDQAAGTILAKLQFLAGSSLKRRSNNKQRQTGRYNNKGEQLLRPLERLSGIQITATTANSNEKLQKQNLKHEIPA